MVTGALTQTSSVWPSGAALATAAVPVVPPAPGRFSTTIDWPSASASGSRNSRAMKSVEAPGGKGATMVIGRLG